MNYKMILRLLGTVLKYEGLLMLPSLGISVLYGGADQRAFILSIALLIAVGVPLGAVRVTNKPMRAREGFAAVAIIWLVMSVFGALPFMLSGAIPNFIDAVFECASGFTTTGSTLVTNVEALPHGILFWRSFTHWLGGMGVLMLTMALLPSLGAGAGFLLKAESPGPAPGKLLPKLGQTAKALYAIYFAMTVALVAALALAGMPLFDALIHALGTAGTGGFSNRNLSVGAYANPAAEWIITIFMLLFGVNFSIYFYVTQRQFRRAVKNEELRWYGIVVLAVSAVVFLQILPVYRSAGDSVRHAMFQVSSIVTTTGYSSVDFNLWPQLSKSLLLCLMFMGACAGSTAGGLKVIRLVLLSKLARRAMIRMVHPRMVQPVKLEGKPVQEELSQSVLVFFVAYMAIIVFGLLVISMDNLDLQTSLTAVITCISNVGPGLGLVGPMGNFSIFSHLSKAVLTLVMIIGRLEIFPVLLLFSGRMWRNQ